MAIERFDTLLFDLGDVLFTWSAETKTSIPPRILKQILRSSSWFEYEKGNLSETVVYERVAAEFDLDAAEVARAFVSARESLCEVPEMIELIIKLKPGRKVMSCPSHH